MSEADLIEPWSFPSGHPALKLINETPLLQSLLYDLELLPEQVTDARRWYYLESVCNHFAAALQASPVAPASEGEPERLGRYQVLAEALNCGAFQNDGSHHIPAGLLVTFEVDELMVFVATVRRAKPEPSASLGRVG